MLSNAPKLTIHPAANTYPAMTDDEYQSLVADIHQNGLRLAILVHENKINFDDDPFAD